MVLELSETSRSPTFLRLALGLVYFHFGLLKFFPDLSPAELIATQTVMSVTHHWLDAHQAQLVLACLECAIGLGFLFNVLPRVTFVLFMLHMAGTFLPLFLLPELTFKIAPLAPNVEGQYILKNLVFVAAGWTILFPHLFPRTRAMPRMRAGRSEAGRAEPTPAAARRGRHEFLETVPPSADGDPSQNVLTGIKG